MNRIKEVLVQKELTQTWLASQLGKSYNMVNGYVQTRRQPSIEVLFEIANILGVSPKDLLIDSLNSNAFIDRERFSKSQNKLIL